MDSGRYAFGRNWSKYVDRHFDEARLARSQGHLLEFLDARTLAGKTFLDIGSGSGIHSLAAFRAGAARVVSFDYDPDSTQTTRRLFEREGSPARWEVSQGSILDDAFVSGLPLADVVYSWGVLHHTGDQWNAIRKAASRIAPGGRFYISLYTSDAFVDPPPEFWLDVKQRYNRAGWLGQRAWEAWYLWRFQIGWNPLDAARLVARVLREREGRGMALMTDIRDWLGGWPMEFSSIAEVKRFCGEELGLELLKLKAGEATTEYLFARPESAP